MSGGAAGEAMVEELLPPGWVVSATAAEEPALPLGAARAWRTDEWIVLDVCYEGPRCGIVRLHFAFGREDGREGLAGFTLLPGVPARLAFPLAFLDAQALKRPRRPASLRSGYNGPPMPATALREVRLELKTALGPHALHVKRAWVANAEPVYPVPAVTLVDALGQWTQRTWPGKAEDPAAVATRLQAELAEARARPARYPEGWTRFGGDAGTSGAAGAMFRVERSANGRWWLRDPAGGAFFSVGLNGVTPGVAGPVVAGEEGFHAELDAGATQMNYAQRNLERVFGESWAERWRELTRDRLVRWGFNTVANWSDDTLRSTSGLPYVVQWPRFPRTPVMLFRDFPDVFDPAYARDAAACAEVLRATRDDPQLIGYFLTNEPKWGFGDFNLAALMLDAHPDSHTRRALAAWLDERYGGDQAAWRRAWARPDGVSLADVVGGRWRPEDLAAPGAREDLWAFSRRMVRRYHEVPTEAARAVDPHHLNLGLRYAYLPNDLPLQGGELFDVYSINAYGIDPPLRVVDEIVATTGRPVIIGEFHVGAPDRGLPSTGLRGVRTQADRGRAYRRYVEAAAAHPAVVGAHWFILNDQPLLGRGDGENYQIGFVDVCHRPYDELVAAATTTHRRLPDLAQGRVAAFHEPIEEIPNNLFPTVFHESWRAQQ